MARIFNSWIATFARVDDILRGKPINTNTPTSSHWHLMGILVVSGCWYGLVMGAFGGGGLPRPAQMACSAAKVPLVLVGSFSLSLPSFFVLNTILGLRTDFADCLKALRAAQAALTVILASLAPLTAVWYLTTSDYHNAILFNSGMFAIASFAAQWALRRAYRPLVQRNHRHRWMLRAWLTIYTLVGIQMGWVLRPFVGDPAMPTTFFRNGAFTNAYVLVAHLLIERFR
jgi:hypothetical protein